MVSERLLHSRVQYTVQLVVIAGCISTGYFFAREKYLASSLLFCMSLLSTWSIFALYNGTNKALSFFFNALRNNDTTAKLPLEIRNKSLKSLFQSMNDLNRHFQAIKLQNEYNEKYYKTLIRHSATGLLVLNSDNQVELINRVACQYAGISPDSTNPSLLKIRNPKFYEAICNLKPGEDVTYRHVIESNLQLLLFRATLLTKDQNTVKLVSIQDIRHELELKELESYRKLISVLTHEIMNLTSPLTSVSKALYTTYHKGGQAIGITEVDDQVLKTTLNSLQVIEEQTNSILNFIDNYRKVSRIPQPDIRPFDLEEWVEQLGIVYGGEMKERNIAFKIDRDIQAKSLLADKKLLNQVMINLVNNAIDAVNGNPGEKMISIVILPVLRNRIRIIVSNNGSLIEPEIRERIFVPFFTTKKNGSGIGLSICQEIIKLHQGSLTVMTSDTGLTSFVLEI
ncbi:MAG: HAMP domain-containing histidine kinase [Bacteroidales bacterium]|nr:HAMP domain-containing histidine kinase [Bacteroidales bacterium]